MVPTNEVEKCEGWDRVVKTSDKSAVSKQAYISFQTVRDRAVGPCFFGGGGGELSTED